LSRKIVIADGITATPTTTRWKREKIREYEVSSTNDDESLIFQEEAEAKRL